MGSNILGKPANNGTREYFVDPNSDLFLQIPGTDDTKEIQEANHRLQIIYDLGRLICEETELEKVLANIMSALPRLIDFERCFVATYDAEGRLRARAAHNIELSEDRNAWPVSKTLVNRVLQEGISLLSSDALQDEQFSNISSITIYKTRSMMCVPLGPKGGRIGLIYADDTRKARSFSQVDLLFLTALSHYIYLGLRNASTIARVTAERTLSDERWVTLQQELLRQHQIVGKSPKLLQAYDRLRRVAEKDVPILLLGETGTGKELFAKAAHNLSQRQHQVFISLNIAALSESLIESELFGHEKGAFTGAIARKIGRFELANGGTLFLDEVGEIPLHVQRKLLRVLEERRIDRVGGVEPIPLNVRLITATNKDLQTAMQKGEFRDDLYFRLHGVSIQIPPLRERVDDLPELIEHFLKKLGSTKSFTDAAIRRMQSYVWPGNVRQLERVVEGMDALCERDEVREEDLPANFDKPPAASQKDSSPFAPLREVMAKVEKEHMRRALEITEGNSERAIKMLGISRATFFERKRLYEL